MDILDVLTNIPEKEVALAGAMMMMVAWPFVTVGLGVLFKLKPQLVENRVAALLIVWGAGIWLVIILMLPMLLNANVNAFPGSIKHPVANILLHGAAYTVVSLSAAFLILVPLNWFYDIIPMATRVVVYHHRED